MSTTQDPTQSGGASTMNFLVGSDEPKTDPVSSDLPSDFFSQMSDPKIEATPAAGTDVSSGQTFFAHTVDASASVLGAPTTPAAPTSGLVIQLDEAETAALESPTPIATEIRIQAAPSDDAAILASILSVSPSVSSTASTDPSVDDVYRDMVRNSLSSERTQGGISRVRTYAVALLVLVIGGGGFYAYSGGMISIVPPDEEPPAVLDSAPPVAASTGSTSTGSAASGSVASDAPALDLMRRDSGTIANKKRNNAKKRTVSTGSTIQSGAVSTSR